MRRIMAYLVMMLTVIGCLVFNIQTTLSNASDGMEFTRSTQLVFSLTKREATDYDSELYPSIQNGTDDLDDIDIEEVVMERLDLAGVRNAEVAIVNGDADTNEGYQLKITMSPYSSTELENVIAIVSRTGYLSVGTYEDQTILTQDNSDFFADTVAELVYDGTTPYPTLNIGSDVDFQTMVSAAQEAATLTGTDASTDDSETEETEETEDTEETDDDSSEDQSDKLYIWYNKTLDDTYAKAYGTDDTVIDEDVLSKVVAIIDVDDYDYDDATCTITSDLDGNSFTISGARALVNLLNAEDYGFDIQYLYSNRVSALFGTSSLYIIYAIMGVALLLICILLGLLFGLSGITASVTLLGSIFFSLLLSTLLGFEFSMPFIIGLFVVAFLSLFISVNYFQHVKNELKKGRDYEKSNSEGYHKSFFISLDVSVIIFAVSLFSFLLSSGSFQVFFGVVMVGSIFTFFITNYVNKILSYFLVKNATENRHYFSLFDKKENDKKVAAVNTTASTTEAENEKVEEKNDKPKKKRNWLLIAIPTVASVLCGVSLGVNYAVNGSLFNRTDSYENTYTLNITFQTDREAYDELDSTSAFLLYIEGIGEQASDGQQFTAYSDDEAPEELPDYSFIYYTDTAYVTPVEKTDEDGETYYINYYTVEVDRDLNEIVLADGTTDVLNLISETVLDGEVTIDLNPNTTYQTSVLVAPGRDGTYIRSSLEVGCYLTTPTNISYMTNNFFLIFFLIPLFAAIYALLRYGLNMALTLLITGETGGLLFVGLLSALQIPFNTYTSVGAMVAIMALLVILIPLLYNNHIVLKESKSLKYTFTDEHKEEIVKDSYNRLKNVPLVPVVSLIILFLSLFIVNSLLYGLAISSLIYLVLLIPLAIFFGVKLYLYLFQHISFKKLYDKHMAKKAEKAEGRQVAQDGITYVDDGPHETIIPGLNDFLR